MTPFEQAETEKSLREKRAEREREKQVIVNAYHRVFKSPDGHIIIDDLDASFAMSQPTFTQRPDGTYDPLAAAIRDGERGILLYIYKMLKKPCIGDANIEPKPKVIRE